MVEHNTDTPERFVPVYSSKVTGWETPPYHTSGSWKMLGHAGVQARQSLVRPLPARTALPKWTPPPGPAVSTRPGTAAVAGVPLAEVDPPAGTRTPSRAWLPGSGPPATATRCVVQPPVQEAAAPWHHRTIAVRRRAAAPSVP